ncbi:MAG: hypothetical protein ACPGC9_00985 [Cytophagales bacterium]
MLYNTQKQRTWRLGLMLFAVLLWCSHGCSASESLTKQEINRRNDEVIAEMFTNALRVGFIYAIKGMLIVGLGQCFIEKGSIGQTRLILMGFMGGFVFGFLEGLFCQD